MICDTCKDAADGVEGGQHCGEPNEVTQTCTCQHREKEQQE